MLNFILVFLVPLLVPLTAIAARAHGAGEKNLDGTLTGWPSWGRKVSTIYFSVIFALANYAIFHSVWAAVISAVISGTGIATGHGRFYFMKGANLQDPNPETIERRGAMWFWQKVLKKDISKPAYSWFCMGIKGLWIGLPLGPFALLLAVVWPLGYWLGFHRVKNEAAPEWISGGLAGYVIAIALIVNPLLAERLGAAFASPSFSYGAFTAFQVELQDDRGPHVT